MRHTHDRYLKLASASLDGTLSSSEQRVLERHCRECAGCRTVLRELRKLRGLLAAEGAADVPPFFMTRLRARLKDESSTADPWVYEAKRLFPVFSLIAIVLFLVLLLDARRPVMSADDYYFSHVTPAEHRVLMQPKSYTNDEVFVLAVTDERNQK